MRSARRCRASPATSFGSRRPARSARVDESTLSCNASVLSSGGEMVSTGCVVSMGTAPLHRPLETDAVVGQDARTPTLDRFNSSPHGFVLVVPLVSCDVGHKSTAAPRSHGRYRASIDDVFGAGDGG